MTNVLGNLLPLNVAILRLEGLTDDRKINRTGAEFFNSEVRHVKFI